MIDFGAGFLPRLFPALAFFVFPLPAAIAWLPGS